VQNKISCDPGVAAPFGGVLPRPFKIEARLSSQLSLYRRTGVPHLVFRKLTEDFFFFVPCLRQRLHREGGHPWQNRQSGQGCFLAFPRSSGQ
jgi:hypothetical protein